MIASKGLRVSRRPLLFDKGPSENIINLLKETSALNIEKNEGGLED